MTYPDLAMIIPVWFEETVPEDLIRERLLRTLTGVGHYVHPGKVVVDGDGRSAEILYQGLLEFWNEPVPRKPRPVHPGLLQCFVAQFRVLT